MPVALGETNGTVRFTTALDTMNRIARCDDDEAGCQLVAIRRLDDICEGSSPTFMKLDVEGFEKCVLAGAPRTLASPSLLAIQSETSDAEIASTPGLLGFEPMYYDPFRRRICSAPFGYSTANTLFIRDLEAVEMRVAEAPYRNILGKRI